MRDVLARLSPKFAVLEKDYVNAATAEARSEVIAKEPVLDLSLILSARLNRGRDFVEIESRAQESQSMYVEDELTGKSLWEGKGRLIRFAAAVLQNKHRTIRRYHARYPIALLTEVQIGEHASKEVDPLERVLRKEFNRDLQQLINSLPHDEGILTQLVLIDEMLIKDAAEELKILPGQAYRRFDRARKRLRSQLREVGWCPSAD